MFNSQSSSFIGGGGAFSDDPSSGLAFMGEDLEHHRQFRQLSASGFSSNILDPLGHSDSSVLLTPASFHSQSEGFAGEFSSYGSSAMPAIFYDPAAAMNLNLDGGLFHQEYGVYLGSRGSGAGSYVRVMEEGYGGSLECSKMENKRGKGMMRGLEEFGQKNEKQRRERLGEKFEVLKSLIPNPTKPDRATIISDAIDYIKELLRTVDELKTLVGKKRSKKERSIKFEMEDEAHGDMESSSIKSMVDESDHELSGRSMRSSWIQRRSKATFVDVRIIEDEVYIKLTQRKRADCSLIVSRVLDELQLELMHLSGGNIGDSHIFMISTKINEGSTVYASSVARRFVEVMDG